MTDRPEPESLADRDVARFSDAVELLEAIVADRSLMAELPDDLKRRLLMAAGRVSRPDKEARKALSKAERKARLEQRRAKDARALAETGIRRLREKPVLPSPRLSSPEDTSVPRAAAPDRSDPEGPELAEPRNCYVCKHDFCRLHHFYDALCPSCATFNWSKRHQTADLTGRVAIVTGGRVKIGYQAALKLLRAGAKVLVTTRFPRDAAARFSQTDDFEAWRHRVEVHGLDLRHTPSVEAFARYVDESQPRLDFILNNACQTVRRPPAFYRHMMERERDALGGLSDRASRLLHAYEGLRAGVPLSEGGALAVSHDAGVDRVGIERAAELSQVPLLLEDLESGAHLFPAGRLDGDLQQVDLRKVNSWRLPLADVPTVELLEVHLINAVAPFVLNGRLKPLMTQERTFDKHIVNVSAMEGQFKRSFKTDKHPHTNMAKAALNMMTRTSAPDYAKDGIYMNSVDTGWITDEDPVEHQLRKTEEHGFHPPLDTVDAAARICDPIFAGLLSGDHVWGRFLKDYRPVDW